MTEEICCVTVNEFDRFKRLMEVSVRRSPVAALLTTEWHGTTYRATAPGVAAVGRFHNGEVRVRIIISFPATLMRDTIVSDIQRTLRESGCSNLRSG